MYYELVNRLRSQCRGYGKECEDCNADGNCRSQMENEAADAIEELSKKYLSSEVDNTNLTGWLAEEYAKHQWIPVTERLPEEYKDVLCYYEYFRYGDYNCMFRTIDRGYYGDGRWGGEAGQGHKNKVLAWMPLPSTEGLNEA